MHHAPDNHKILAAVDEAINTYFENSVQNAAKIDASYSQLWEVTHGLINSGGKRLRPKITILAYLAFGGTEWKKIVPVAAAQEFLHFSLLIHDDIIDRDVIRYGNLNVIGKYKNIYSEFLPSPAEQTHFANSAALLAGDLMLSASHQLIAESELNEKKKLIAHQLLSKSIFEVAGGELLDTESSFTPSTDCDALKIARYKTASYTFVTPMLTGAMLADAPNAQVSKLKDLALALGTAYQLVDDLIGIFGDKKVTGKSTNSDILEGKKTFMVEQAVNAMSVVEKAKFDSLFGNHAATTEQIEDIKSLLVATGAKAKTEQSIKIYADKAQACLALLELDEHFHNEFAELITKVTERAY